MKNNSKIIVIIVIVISIILIIGLSLLIKPSKPDEINGIENYNKEFYIKKYGGDLDSNLSIFPDDKSVLINPEFSSSFITGLFDTDGYMLLTSKYSEENFKREMERLSNLKMVIKSTCYDNTSEYTNNVKYDDLSYSYPAYVTIDGFGNTYEYALINEKDLEIIYVYLSYPSIKNTKYNKYLKKDKKEYSKTDAISLYSMYNHTFDNGRSFAEFDDCN